MQPHPPTRAILATAAREHTRVVDDSVNDLRYRFVVENTTDYAIFTMDLDGVVETWNAGAARMLGYSEAEMKGQSADRIFGPEEIAAGSFATEMRTAKAMGRADDEGWLQRKDGTRFWASGLLLLIHDEAGRVIGLAKIVRDASERRDAERALESSELRFRSLVEQSPLSTLIVGPDGRVRQVNAAWVALWGQSFEEVRGSDLSEAAEGQTIGLLPHLTRALAGESLVPPPVEYTPRHGVHAGEPVWVWTHLYPVKDGDGSVREVVIVQEDVTERRRMEEALRQTQRLESLGVLAGGIAHDFNNLLTTILLNVTLALQSTRAKATARTAGFLQKAIGGTTRAADLTRQLLAYAGKGEFDPQLIDLTSLVRESRDLLRVTIPKRITLQLDLAPDLPLVYGDRSQLQQVVMNLVQNAAEAYGDQRGTVEVRVRLADGGVPDMRRRLPSSDDGATCYLELQVTDKGIGMDAATQARIYDPFFTTKFTGRGLGLAAVQGTVRSHGGFLGLQSAPGQGTTFSVLLPAEGARSARPAHAISPEDLAGKGLVLVIDDEEDIRELTQQTLSRYGYSVVAAGDGREAIRQFRELGQAVSVVLLDTTMPVMDGPEVLDQLRHIRGDVRVLAMSGYGELEARRRLDGAGIQGFLRKPFTAEQLAQAVKQAIPETGADIP